MLSMKVFYFHYHREPRYFSIVFPGLLTLRGKSAKVHQNLCVPTKLQIHNYYPEHWLKVFLNRHSVRMYLPDISNPEDYIDEIVGYVNQMELVTISYYPFFKGQHSKAEFQKAFDFLHSRINNPVAFVETSHLAQDLSVSSFNLFIEGDTCEQNAYLETLLTNAREHNYEFVIWWAHRDFDALWQTFPEELKDLGKLWRNTGLLDDNGNERPSYLTWKHVFDK